MSSKAAVKDVMPYFKRIYAGNKKIRNEMFKLLLGNRDGITIIGPASVVKEIGRDPNKIQLLTLEKSKGVKKISKKK